MNKVALTNSLGLPTTATDTEVEMAVAAAAKGSADYTRLKNELEADRQKVAKERAEVLVKNAVAQKKIGAGQEAAFVTMATNNYDTVKEMLDGLAGVTPITNQLQPDTQTPPTELTPSNDDRTKWNIHDWMKSDAPGLKNMAEKEPAKYQALVANYATTKPSN